MVQDTPRVTRTRADQEWDLIVSSTRLWRLIDDLDHWMWQRDQMGKDNSGLAQLKKYWEDQKQQMLNSISDLN